MRRPLASSAVLEPAVSCVVRRQEQGYLLYNRETDEMHVVPAIGHYVFALCDGVRPIGEIVAQLEAKDAASDERGRHVHAFLEELTARGLLTVLPEEPT